MKKYLKLLIIVAIIFITSGCVKYSEEMKIHNSKSINIDLVFAVNKKISNYEFDSKKISDLEELGYRVSDYNDDNYKGIRLKYKIRNIDKVSTNKDVTYSLTDIRNNTPNKMFKVKKSFFKNYYKATFIFDSTDIDPITINDDEKETIEYLCDDGSVVSVSRDGEVPEGCHRVFDYEIENAKSKNPLNSEQLNEKYNKNDLTYIVHLPSKAISNNADLVKGKTLTWNLKDNGVTDINYEFSIINHFNILFVLLIVVLVLITIRYFVISVKSTKKKKKKVRKKNKK